MTEQEESERRVELLAIRGILREKGVWENGIWVTPVERARAYITKALGERNECFFNGDHGECVLICNCGYSSPRLGEKS